MKRALLLHNPGAGDEEHSKEELIALIEQHGYECLYASVKDKQWKDFDYDVDFLVIAGGDGTVRNVAKRLLNRKMIDKIWPIGLLPYGTANNIAKTLQLTDDTSPLIQSWKKENLLKYDVGRIENVKEAALFLESLGIGIFPYLMLKMKERQVVEDETPEESMAAALHLLYDISLTYEPHHCQLQIDGIDHSGQFILLEVMNTKSIGPNLFLAPDANPDDGVLDIVAVTEADRATFQQYIADKINGEERPFNYTRFQARSVAITWEGTHLHVDDEVIKMKKEQAIKIEVKEGLLPFLIP
ncbi:diacylglycerol/lipid kinase family protein [Flavisolibacter tropicus]|uniref:Diacylglycerol kinase n=1 Tax=Flavisolibacter tropicus TaxID=1492898 RepID=A0A172TWS6_9BACT|nr:diacylglycerol kinase family protein [Flavisolibacter tropicus]ANE51456.1 diacylglycerol kinase [Flavisolibacter tropicus]